MKISARTLALLQPSISYVRCRPHLYALDSRAILLLDILANSIGHFYLH